MDTQIDINPHVNPNPTTNFLTPTVRIIHTLPTTITCTVYRERDRMAREFALTRAKLSLPYIPLHTSDLDLPCLMEKRVACLEGD